MNYELKDIAKIVGGEVLQEFKPHSIHSVFIDSRSFHGQSHALFIAIKGDNHNANNFIEELYQNGQRSFIVSDDIDLTVFPEANVVLVSDGIQALQKIAQHHRQQVNIPIIGITGSNGKTIVKEWLYHVLKDNYNICRSPKSYNSQIGVPLSVLQLRSDHTLGLFEAGISQPGEMNILESIISPTLGVLTHIGSSHQENFKDQAELKSEKTLLFKNCEFISFEDNTLRISDTQIEGDHAKLMIQENDEIHSIEIPFSDEAAIQNSLTVAKVARSLGLSWESISLKLKDLPSIALRLELLDGVYNSKIINDTYNSDVSGLEIALGQLQKMAGKQKSVILSSIQKDQGALEKTYQTIFSLLNQANLDRLILIGDDISKFKHLYSGSQIANYTNIDAALNELHAEEFKDHWILIKGARKFRFERLLEVFENTPHSTRLEIKLDHLSHNLKSFKALLSPNTKLMCMVKAMAYGSGEHEVVKHLADQRIDYFGVAYTVEGIKIREAGIDIPVMVMNSDQVNFSKLIDHQLEPVIYSLNQLDDFIRVLIKKQITAYPIHIEFDTGMHRLGFEAGDIQELSNMILSQPEVKVKSIFSHLAAADDPEAKDLTKSQIAQFEQWSSNLQEKLDYPVMRHICNSSGISHYPEAHFDMVRLGLGLYGLSDDTNLKLKPVSSLKTTITQIKTVKAGDGVGYGFSDKLKQDGKIGIIPIGYADGLKRQLSNGQGRLLHTKTQQLLPIIGRVCMDMTMLNLGDVSVEEGDEIEIFGEQQAVEDFAKMMDTIAYEALTSVSNRVKRIYISE